jgi:hypothetical protein
MPDISGLTRYTPSQHSPWMGGRPDGFTDAQHAKIRACGEALARARARNNLPANYRARLPLAARAGDGGERRYTDILCPVVTASRDRARICVIAPDGSNQWINWK